MGHLCHVAWLCGKLGIAKTKPEISFDFKHLRHNPLLPGGRNVLYLCPDLPLDRQLFPSPAGLGAGHDHLLWLRPPAGTSADGPGATHLYRIAMHSRSMVGDSLAI